MRASTTFLLGIVMLFSIFSISPEPEGPQDIVQAIGANSHENGQEEDLILDSPGRDFFIENRGQWGQDVYYMARTGFGSIVLGDGFVSYRLIRMTGEEDEGLAGTFRYPLGPSPDPFSVAEIKVQYAGSDRPIPTGCCRMDSYSNYFYGSDPDGWVSRAGHFERVRYSGLWDSIDIEFYFGTDGPKYDIILHPGADPDMISLRVDRNIVPVIGEREVGFEVDGEILLTDGALRTFYMDNGEEIVSSFEMRSTNTIGLRLEGYQESRTVVIDPLVYATFIGGQRYDHCYDCELDSSENVLVSGDTASEDFHAGVGTFDTTYNGGYDLFVMKFDPSGKNLIFTTFLGGGYSETYGYIEIDSNDDIFVLGSGGGEDFPVTPGAYDTNPYGSDRITLSKLSSDGTKLLASTFFGGSSLDLGFAMMLDDMDRPYITGYSWSKNLPTTSGVLQPESPGGHHDAFVSCLSSNLSDLVRSTYIGGEGRDEGYGLNIDTQGNIIVTGQTDSTDYPTTVDANVTQHMGGSDGFLMVLDPTMTNMLYSTFIGGSSEDRGYDIEIGSRNRLYVTGFTGSSEFYVTPGAYQKPNSPVGYAFDVFLMKFDLSRNRLEYSTVIGGYERDYGISMKVDDREQVYITGLTESPDFPTTYNADYNVHNGNEDIFFTMFNLTTNKILYSTFMGGAAQGNDEGHDLELTEDLDVWITGYSSDYLFNITPDAFDNVDPGGDEGVLVKFHVPDPPSAPRGLGFDLRKGSIGLEWLPPSDEGDEMLTGYMIYRGLNGSRLSLYKTIGKTTSYDDLNIDNHYTYQYLVTAFSWIGESPPSNIVTVKDDQDPYLVSDLTSTTGLSGEAHEFRSRVNDNVGISRVTLHLDIEGKWSDHEMMNQSGTDHWSYILRIDPEFSGDIRYRIEIEDFSSNIIFTVWRTVKISDEILPFVTEDISDALAVAGYIFNFRVKVNDNLAVRNVSVEYWYWGGEHTNDTMDQINSTTFRKNITTESRTGTITYRYHLEDVSGNWNRSIPFSREIVDDVPPVFGGDLSTNDAGTGDRFVFRVSVSDNLEVIGVFVEYWMGDIPHNNRTMMGDDEPTCSIDLPSDSLLDLEFFFSAQDVSGNWARTKVFRRTVLDNDPPVLSAGWEPPKTVGTGDILSLNVPIKDNIELHEVIGHYSFDDGSSTDVPLLDGDVIWLLNISIPEDRLGTVHIMFSGKDTSQNSMQSTTFNVTIVDNKKPTILPIENITVDERAQFTIQVLSSDNIGVVSIEWNGFPVSHSGDVFNGSVDRPGRYQVKVVATDGAGNSASASFILTVIDIKEDGPSHLSTTAMIMIGAAILIVVILSISLMIFLLARRRKKSAPIFQEKTEEPVEEISAPAEEQKEGIEEPLLNPLPLTEEQINFLNYTETSGTFEEPHTQEEMMNDEEKTGALP
ncbi:MAG: SBBP repeat-containing protein [Thermoplasmatota archaeon]